VNVTAYLKRLDRLEAAMGQSRLRVVSGPLGGDFTAAISEEISAGRARKTDFFVWVNRFADDWKPE